MMTGETNRRRWPVTLFSFLVLLFGGGFNLARGLWAWDQARVLVDLSWSTSLPMNWLAATSLFWALVFAVCSVGLWRVRSWGRRATLIGVTLYHGHIWVNHWLFARSDYTSQVRPFSILNTALVLVLVWGFLNWPSVRAVFDGGDGALSNGEDI
jgi:uncharacterized membrane protein (DUF2068 family)